MLEIVEEFIVKHQGFEYERAWPCTKCTRKLLKYDISLGDLVKQMRVTCKCLCYISSHLCLSMHMYHEQGICITTNKQASMHLILRFAISGRRLPDQYFSETPSKLSINIFLGIGKLHLKSCILESATERDYGLI